MGGSVYAGEIGNALYAEWLENGQHPTGTEPNSGLSKSGGWKTEHFIAKWATGKYQLLICHPTLQEIYRIWN